MQANAELLSVELRIALQQSKRRIQETIHFLKNSTVSLPTDVISIKNYSIYLDRITTVYDLIDENQSEFINLINSLLEKKSVR
jgi:hypothetical protein